jgi:ABC-type glycerol-3-phosphate transport system substrate-binding protein
LGLILLTALSACSPTAPAGEPPPAEVKASSTPKARLTPSAIPTSRPTSTPAVQIAVDVARLQGTTIRFWHPWSGATAETLQALVDEFNRANEYQITVEVTAQPGGWDDLENRLTGALETGEPPDLTAGFMYQAARWDRQGHIVDLDPYFSDPHWGFGQEESLEMHPAVFNFAVSHTDDLDIPYRSAMLLLPSTTLLIYNVTWAQELGYRTPPTTIQEFADQNCAAADSYRKDGNPENDGYGGMIVSPDYNAALNWIYTFGGSVTHAGDIIKGGSVYAFNQSPTTEVFSFLRDLYDEGCVWATDQVYTEEQFARRSGLFATADLLDLPNWAEAMQRAGNADKWAVIPYPNAEAAKTVGFSGPALVVFKSSPERQLAAWLLIEWLVQPSNHARLVAASGAFPLRRSEIALLDDYRVKNPQWSMALEVYPGAQRELPYESWGEVRWALADAYTQLFRSYFDPKNIPTMLEYLDAMATELHTGEPPEDLFTPVPMPTE